MPSLGLAEMKELAHSRASVYAFFADMFFQEANEVFVERLREEAATGEEYAAFLAEPLVGLSVPEAVSQLRSEYAALFLAMSASPVFTSESVYLSGSHCLMQEQRDEVLQTYREEGFSVSGDFRQPEDHLAVELNFMSRLCRESALLDTFDNDKAFLEYGAKQRAFFQAHISQWVPEFCTVVQNHPKAAFYGGVAHKLELFLALEADILKEG